jgi:hypothetical protein
MMVSMAGKKGSMLFGQGGQQDNAILTAPLISSIVRCVPLLRIETAAAGFYQGE